MQVFVLGAGISHSAGYPLANGLLCELDRRQSQSNVSGESPAWKEVTKWISENRDSIPGFHTGKLDANLDGNLEYLLTYLDLRLMAAEDRKNCIWKTMLSERTDQEKTTLTETLGQHLDNSRPEKKLRKTITNALVTYFRMKNYDDASGQNNSNRRFIHTFCEKKVEQGDVIISFNYDSLVERSLRESGKWSPVDGYGFEVQFETDGPFPPTTPPPNPTAQSETTVLKLHGSVGWYLNNNKEVFLHQHFLKLLEINCIKDVKEPKLLPNVNSLPSLIEPSFIKQIDDIPTYRHIWQRAREELARAEAVYIIGYSLPDADIMAKNLLVHSLDKKPDQTITVVNPDRATSNKFEALLGGHIEYIESKFEKWIEDMYARTESR